MDSRLEKVKHVFLDMDGTIYNGSVLFPTTIPFLDFLTSRGIGYTFVSNNSSRSTAEYIAHMEHFGIPVTAENFYTSADYAIDYLKQNYPEYRRVYVLGVKSLKKTFEDAGFVMDDEKPDAVVVGFDRELTFERLCKAAYFLRCGVPGFATHPDLFCPTNEPTWLVDCGAMTACLELSTNTKIHVLGKPDPGMLRAAAARKGFTADQVLMAGDRLSTDIALGQYAGAVTCQILPCADFNPPPEIKPDFVLNNLGELQALWQ